MANEHFPLSDAPHHHDLETLSRPKDESLNRPRPVRIREPGLGIGGLLASAVLGLLTGGVGAWAYMNVIHPQLAKEQAAVETPAAAAGVPEGNAIPGRLEEFSNQLAQLQARIDKLPHSTPPPDLEPINERITSVGDLAKKLETQQARIATLPEKFDQNVRKVTSVMADLEGMKNELASLRTEVHSAKPAPGATAPRSDEKPKEVKAASISDVAPDRVGEETYARALDQFRNKQYKEAGDTFGQLTRSRPDDARVWYFAALSRGFSTGDWKGETEQLVKHGVDNEQAGKPEKAKIDEAFSELTTASGKDWLAFYRRTVSRPESAAR